MMTRTAELMALRRYLRQFLLNLDIDANETYVSTLIELIEHFYDNPEDYEHHVRNSTNK